MDLRRIHYFMILCHTFNFSQAACSLGISQPALTKAIMRLEQELGGKLLRREGKHTHLTPFGHAMKQHFDELEAAVERARISAARFLQGQLDRIQIAVMSTIGLSKLASAFQAYRSQYPDVAVHVYDTPIEGLGDMLLNGERDCALVSNLSTLSDRFRVIRLYEESMMIVHLPEHRFEQCDTLTENDLAQEHVLQSTTHRIAQSVTTDKTLGSDINFMVHSDRIAWLQSLVSAGFGVALVPENTAVLPGLRATPMNCRKMNHAVSVVVPRGRMDNPVVHRFIQCVSDYPVVEQISGKGEQADIKL